MKSTFRRVKNNPHALAGLGAQGVLCIVGSQIMPRNGESVLVTGLLGLVLGLVLAIGAWLSGPEAIEGEIVGLNTPELPDAQLHMQGAPELPKAA